MYMDSGSNFSDPEFFNLPASALVTSNILFREVVTMAAPDTFFATCRDPTGGIPASLFSNNSIQATTTAVPYTSVITQQVARLSRAETFLALLGTVCASWAWRPELSLGAKTGNSLFNRVYIGEILRSATSELRRDQVIAGDEIRN